MPEPSELVRLVYQLSSPAATTSIMLLLDDYFIKSYLFLPCFLPYCLSLSPFWSHFLLFSPFNHMIADCLFCQQTHNFSRILQYPLWTSVNCWSSAMDVTLSISSSPDPILSSDSFPRHRQLVCTLKFHSHFCCLLC